MNRAKMAHVKGRLIAFFLSWLTCIGGSALAVRAHVPFEAGPQDTAAKAEAAVRRLFGAGVEVAKDRNPYFLTGDFNGDSRQDLVALVRLKGAKSSLPKEVVALNPWGYEGGNSQASSNLALVVVHGAAAGWDTQTPAGRYFLADRDYFSTPTWEGPTPEGVKLLALKRKIRLGGGGSRRGLEPRMAKGDAVILPTEAGIDIYLYWDGKTYKVYEPPEEP